MNTKTRRAGAIASSVAAVALVVGGAWGVGAALAQPGDTPAPAPTSTFEPSRFVDVEPEPTDTPTPEPVPSELPVTEEPAPVEPAPAEPAPAQPAPAPAPAPAPPVVEPAPAPAPPPPPVRCPAGSSSTESDGYNDLACMPNTAPNGGSCFEGDNGMLPECQPFRP